MLFKRDFSKDGGPSLSSVHADSPDWDAEDMDEYEKADLTPEGRRALADSDFLAVWTDAQGKKHRKLPVQNAGHLAAARGRIDQAQMPENVKAEARRKLEHMTHKEKPVAKNAFTKWVGELMAAIQEPDVAKRAAAADKLLKDADGVATEMAAPPAKEGEDKEGMEKMKAAHKAMGDTIKSFGAGPHPTDHPIHAMKALHAKMGETLKAAGCEVPSDEPGALDHASPAVTKRINDIENENKELKKRLDEQVNKAADAEMREILKSFKSVPIDLNTDVQKFRKMKQDDPEMYERTMTIFKATDEQLSASKLYKNFGSSTSGGAGSSYEQLVAKAEALITKSKDPMTFEKAFDLVCQENPKLVESYRNEQN